VTQGVWAEIIETKSSDEGMEGTPNTMMYGMYMNAHIIVNKMNSLNTAVASMNPDVIGIAESWANDRIPDSELLLLGFGLFRQDRPCEG
jgi:hypothetical protein